MKKVTVAALAGAGAAIALLAGLGLGWGDRTIVVGSQVISDSGSLINGVGVTNGAICLGAANIVSPAGDTALAGNEGLVLMAAAHSCTLGSAVTNTGHQVAITQTGNGTNAILTVSAQTIAGASKWTNVGQFSCTVLVSDGTNWQLAGSRGN